jgi:AcrR family transcriptional regulator
MTQLTSRRFGRPTAASPDEVIALAGARFLDGERVDVQAIARELGLARATMYRWFGTREGLLGETIARLGEQRLAAHRCATAGRGAKVLVESLYSYNRELLASEGLRALLAREQERALRVLTASGGIVQPRMVAAVKRMIDVEVEDGQYQPPVATDTLAYAVVRLGEAFIYNDAAIGSTVDITSLREAHAALLGANVQAPRGRSRRGR